MKWVVDLCTIEGKRERYKGKAEEKYTRDFSKDRGLCRWRDPYRTIASVFWVERARRTFRKRMELRRRFLKREDKREMKHWLQTDCSSDCCSEEPVEQKAIHHTGNELPVVSELEVKMFLKVMLGLDFHDFMTLSLNWQSTHLLGYLFVSAVFRDELYCINCSLSFWWQLVIQLITLYTHLPAAITEEFWMSGIRTSAATYGLWVCLHKGWCSPALIGFSSTLGPFSRSFLCPFWITFFLWGLCIHIRRGSHWRRKHSFNREELKTYIKEDRSDPWRQSMCNRTSEVNVTDDGGDHDSDNIENESEQKVFGNQWNWWWRWRKDLGDKQQEHDYGEQHIHGQTHFFSRSSRKIEYGNIEEGHQNSWKDQDNCVEQGLSSDPDLKFYPTSVRC